MERNETILVVDDDPRNVRLLEGIFRTAGYAVQKAYSGDEALERIGQTLPDLILLDVMMPGMSGHDLCQRLKRDARTRPIPVVLVTSLSSVEDKVEGLDVGADDFVSKPVNRLELLAKTRSLLRIKALHDEVSRAKQELERKNHELVRLEQLKESLVQMIVHDLKNPLTAIMGNLSLILQPRSGKVDKAERAQKLVHRVEVALESSRVMMRMILDLLDIARLEENKLVLHCESFSPAALVQSSLTENEGLISGGNLDVRQSFPKDLPQAWGDRSLIERVVGNLISNAMKHTPEGGTITVGGGVQEDGSSILLYVRDTGEGISDPHLDRIFEKFYQTESRKFGLKSDRGLGLAFCKMVVDAHGGRIWVESALGAGSTFYVSLPATAPVEAQGETIPAGSPLGSPVH